MKPAVLNRRRKKIRLRTAPAAFAGLLALILVTHFAEAASLRSEQTTVSRPDGEPIMAIVSLRNQQITVYDDKGWIMRASVSSGQKGRETPAGIFSILQKDAEHYSNLYDDAYMPHMQRLTWSGIALHGGIVPGRPASHGCVRMPYDFAERLFGLTRLGMRVIVSPAEAVPVAIDHPALFQPKPGPAAALAKAAAAAAKKAANDAEGARLAASAAYREWVHAMAPVRRLEISKLKADWELAKAERDIASAASPETKEQIEDAKAKLAARVRELETELVAGKADLQPKLQAMTAARGAATQTERVHLAAEEAAQKAARELEPVSVFISRKTQRLYVRQAFQPILEAPIAIEQAERPLGTHIFTAMERSSTGIRWSVVSLSGAKEDNTSRNLRRVGAGAVIVPDVDSAKAALDRIVIPQDTADFIAERVSPTSSLIVSDEGLSSETSKDTDFVVLLSGEPQGGIKFRRTSPRIGASYGQARF